MHIRPLMLALLAISLAVPASAVWQYDDYPRYTVGEVWWQRGYDWQPRMPAFTAYESRPEGFGLVQPKPAYPIPGVHPQARFCENTQVIGHYSRWTRQWHSGFTGERRIAPRARLDSGYCPPQWRYEPSEYWWA